MARLVIKLTLLASCCGTIVFAYQDVRDAVHGVRPQAQSQNAPQGQDESIRNTVRIESLGQRIATIEGQRLDARLSVVERIESKVERLDQWMYGLMLALIGNLVATLLSLKVRVKETRPSAPSPGN